jgi:hypothetical protein
MYRLQLFYGAFRRKKGANLVIFPRLAAAYYIISHWLGDIYLNFGGRQVLRKAQGKNVFGLE